MTLAVGSLVTGITLIFAGAPERPGVAPAAIPGGRKHVVRAAGHCDYLGALSALCILFLHETVFGRRVYYVRSQ